MASIALAPRPAAIVNDHYNRTLTAWSATPAGAAGTDDLESFQRTFAGLAAELAHQADCTAKLSLVANVQRDILQRLIYAAWDEEAMAKRRAEEAESAWCLWPNEARRTPNSEWAAHEAHNEWEARHPWGDA